MKRLRAGSCVVILLVTVAPSQAQPCGSPLCGSPPCIPPVFLYQPTEWGRGGPPPTIWARGCPPCYTSPYWGRAEFACPRGVDGHAIGVPLPATGAPKTPELLPSPRPADAELPGDMAPAK